MNNSIDVIDIDVDFSYKECLVYIDRSKNECLHIVKDEVIYKAYDINGQLYLISISETSTGLKIEYLNNVPIDKHRNQIKSYVEYMFDLKSDLNDFYSCFEDDNLLYPILCKYRGLRIIKIHDLFEGLCWAVIGQQINLNFAYTLKYKLVTKYGKSVDYDGVRYYTFPQAADIASLEVEDLRELQFTGRKSEYLIGIAKLFVDNKLDYDKLSTLNYEDLYTSLIAIRGVGSWTADYVILKCFNHKQAFPIADVGIHNAIKGLLELDKKPSKDEILELSKKWSGWEAYVSFYLWRCLYD